MPNTRELVELLTAAEEYAMDFCIDQHCEDCTARKYGVDCRKYLQADHLIANGVTVQEWIPVSERLPKESGEYIVYCGEYDGICVLYYEILKTKGKWGTKWKEITHWMPLPEPPKGE